MQKIKVFRRTKNISSSKLRKKIYNNYVKSKKARNEMSQGTSELRIPLEGSANTGGANTGQGGGLNK